MASMRAGVLAFFLTFALFTGTAAAQTLRAPSVTASEAFLIDAETGTIHYAKRQTRRVPVASLTKVMTAYVIREEADLDDVVRITPADVRYAAAHGATTGGLRAGERLTVRALLHALLLNSGADASHALAERYGPGTRRFVAKMNAAARALKLRDTRFANPDGLPAQGAYSTARDQAVLARVAMRDRVIATIARTKVKTIGRHTWHNSNKLLGDGVIGLKTGFTTAAGYCLSFVAEVRGHLLIGVVLGETTENRRYASALRMLDWAEERLQ
ncbi:D-alanyl-D-alanine carboxypeptidase family protein [Acrocarpospora catenulata]|uniref:D-alanyl-D-alanine carboxypeptidase family protein n=1 Tax=Acrocarpospora catenulata TaxID=2836182 RepID=UPI001BDA99D9|nr:D-alanyl-D-alanine carboxypeptidase family protein [Acrocarpospora catenulata]